jgi:outer membrane protein assembly factor BamB
MLRRSARYAVAVLAAVSMGSLALAADWPQWRGPARDGIAGSFTAPKAWPEKLTKVWSIEAGGGHASPLVAGGKVYLHARQGGDETVSAFDLASGKLLWRDSYPTSFSPAPEAQKHGLGPFATPALDGGTLYAFGINEILSAYDAASGKLLWRHDFGKEFPTPRPYYGTSASPLVVDGMVVVQAGGEGKGALVALDAKTGKPRWRLESDGPGYGTPAVAAFGGVRQLVVPTQRKILGAALATGAKLWEMPFQVPYDQNILTPVVVGDAGDTFITSGVDTDAQAIRVSRKDGAWATEKVWANRSISMYMSTPVLADGLLCGFSTVRRGHVFCADPKTGEVRWKTEGGEGESAAVVSGGDHLFVLRNDAELQVIRRTGGEIKKVAQYTVADAATWAIPVVMDGRILVKDAARLTLWSLG